MDLPISLESEVSFTAASSTWKPGRQLLEDLRRSNLRADVQAAAAALQGSWSEALSIGRWPLITPRGGQVLGCCRAVCSSTSSC